MAELIAQLTQVLEFFWSYTFTEISAFLLSNGFGLLIICILVTGIIIDTLVEITHIK